MRNPIYIGALLGMLGAALYYRSVGLLIYAMALAIGFHALVLIYEERVLKQSFGADYAEYCRKVQRWLPRLGA